MFSEEKMEKVQAAIFLYLYIHIKKRIKKKKQLPNAINLFPYKNQVYLYFPSLGL